MTAGDAMSADPGAVQADAPRAPAAASDAGPDAGPDSARVSRLVDVVLAGLGARSGPVLGVPAVRIGDRVVARILDGDLLLAPSDAVLPPRPAGLAAESVRPWLGAQPHLRIPLADAVEPTAAAWIRAAVVATAARVPDTRLPEPPARAPHPRRPRT